jgi:transcription elongation factor GreA
MTLATQQRLQAELATLEERLEAEGERVREIAADTTWHGSNEIIPTLTREMSDLTRRIATLKAALEHAAVYDPALVSTETVGLGTRVVVSEDGTRDTYTIVGHTETAPSQGRISPDSPVGHALLGHHVGDVVQVQTPDGGYTLCVEEIAPGA